MIRFHVSNKTGDQEFEHEGGIIELGRGPQRDATPRLIIQDDLYVSKDHLRVLELADGQVRLENLSQRNPVWLADNSTVGPGSQRDLVLPVRLTVGETIVEIENQVIKAPPHESLVTIAKPVRPDKAALDNSGSLKKLGESPDAAKLAQWFETVIAVQRAAAGSAEFYQQTAAALVELVGLDRGLVLLRRGKLWEAVARQPTETPTSREFSQTILNCVVKERRTFYQSAAGVDAATSLQGIEAVVASPIFDARDEIVGVLYGSRARLPEHWGIGPLEAQVVQLLASAVGAGLARLGQEAETARLRVQFEQFFSPALARELERNPRLLEGQEREVTVLFSDIRGFSLLAERLGPRDICRLIGEIMEHLTASVRAHEGVVVDYAGDGMMAMWNAPADQADHAAQACRAVGAILADLPRLAADWESRLGTTLALGLGLNTGMALVGNTGSTNKFKYGPLGHTVNLASRVEGATKHLGIPALLTGSTFARLGEEFATRRLCRVRVVGVREPVDLYELYADQASAQWQARRDSYEKALTLFEASQWAECVRALYPMLNAPDGQYDIPSLNLATRAIEYLKSPPRTFDPVVDLHLK